MRLVTQDGAEEAVDDVEDPGLVEDVHRLGQQRGGGLRHENKAGGVMPLRWEVSESGGTGLAASSAVCRLRRRQK